ncbi:uncharacterized protein LOC119840311 [Zerene cesonia]|uniref:uncharacterized protein LOC119840311 n=1 Tax=Zerene cesonia TaxID=33412 RepID=UPI0018E56458|nr:uncharacterized protein LOC119840311 [Zerene cesonia]
MTSTQCVVQFCKLSIFNKVPGVTFHGCPTSTEMRNKWLHALRHKCVLLDWTKSRICSKHFESHCFDSQRRLKDNAVPTIFPSVNKKHLPKTYISRTKIERILSRMTQQEIMTDIKNSMNKLKEPMNLDNMVNEEMKFKGEVSTEAQLWLIVKKQEHLNTRLMELLAQNKKHVEALQSNIKQNKNNKKDVDQSMETHKYIVKCLQEKLATYEEQIEILTAVEAR